MIKLERKVSRAVEVRHPELVSLGSRASQEALPSLLQVAQAVVRVDFLPATLNEYSSESIVSP